MTQRPYELLARFSPAGTVAGLSVRFITTVAGRDYEGDPQPLTGVNDPAFASFASAFSAAIVSERDSLQQQLATRAAELDSMTAERDAALAALAPVEAERDALRAQLDAILNPPGPDLSTVSGAKQFISNERFTRETGGILIEGQSITTERDEIGHWFPRFYHALMWTMGDARTRAGNPDGLYPYKPKNSAPVVLTAAQVMRAYECMSWYVQTCFAAEATAYAQLDAGVPIQTVLDGLSSLWPSNQFTWQPPA